MKKISYWFYSLAFFALSLPVKAFGMPTQALYGVQVKYGVGPDVPGSFGFDPWYVTAGRWLLFPVLPIIVILIVAFLIIRRARKKK